MSCPDCSYCSWLSTLGDYAISLSGTAIGVRCQLIGMFRINALGS